MPSPRSRSPPPRRRSRSRSGSRERRRHKDREGGHGRKSHGGFKWKEKTRDDERKERTDYRGYRDAERRDRAPRHRDRVGDGPAEDDSYAGREARRDRERRERLRQDEEEDRLREGREGGRRAGGDERKDRDEPRRRDDGSRKKDDGEARDTKRDERRKKDDSNASFQPQGGPVRDVFGEAGASKDAKDGEKKKKKKRMVPQEEMIIVNINDRLGTKAAIPCLASDPIRAFKAQVAARIGRQPHEIMLKRQGERPFKDMLTLADYGVSNGVQLDLELDTGD